jgi:CRP/FNR family transcriptional regulator
VTSWRGRDGTGAAARGARSAPRDASSARLEDADSNVFAFRERKNHCTTCALRARCLPVGLDADAIVRFDQTIASPQRLRKGDPLFHAGEAFLALYAIRFGSLKTSILAEDGREQVAGYHMLGEIVGLDGIATGRHTCGAAALEDSEVCALPFERLEEMMRAVPLLQLNVRQVLAREVSRNHIQMLLLGSMRAEERVVCYLLDLAERYRQRGYSPNEFVLRMTREEIGSFLGLKLETVSRVFSRLQSDGLVQAQGRDIKLLDTPTLHRLLGRDAPPNCP